MSVRPSASRPSSCSGDMYWNVPRIVPSCVRLFAVPIIVGIDVIPDVGAGAVIALARPEVEQLHARLRDHHVARLQVPVHDPLPVRLVQRVRDLRPVPQRLLERQRALGQAIGKRLALEQLHHQVLDAVRVADVVQRADVRVRQLRNRLRFPLEPLPDLRRRRQVLRQHLHRDRPLQPRVLRLVNLAHPASADRRDDLVRAQARSGGEAQTISPESPASSGRSSWETSTPGRAGRRRGSAGRPETARTCCAGRPGAREGQRAPAARPPGSRRPRGPRPP